MPRTIEVVSSLASIRDPRLDGGTTLNDTLVNFKDGCKYSYEVVNQVRINTDCSHHRYDVLILINGVPGVQIELKTLGLNPRRAMEQIVSSKNDPGNGYSEDKGEQQSIADCLSSLDALITAEMQKFEALKTHEEGLMLPLFPSEKLEV